MKSLRWYGRLIGLALALSLGVGAGLKPAPTMGQGLPKLILSLGNDGYLPRRAVEEATGAEVKKDLGGFELTDFSLVILSDIPYQGLPSEVQKGLVEFVQKGGSLLVTGGPNAYGSGGYTGTDIGAILPLKPTRIDWLPHPFGPTFIIQPGHPILSSVTIITMAHFNELDLNSGAVEIAQYRAAPKAGASAGGMTGAGTPIGGVTGTPPGTPTVPGGVGIGVVPSPTGAGEAGGIQGGGRRPLPLVAEGRSGDGTIIAIALDLTQTGSWKDRDPFIFNTIKYLMERSKLGPPKPRSER